MTSKIKLHCNGSYVLEAKNAGGTVIGKAGPGDNVESDWITAHTGPITVEERSATQDEIDAARAPRDGRPESSSSSD